MAVNLDDLRGFEKKREVEGGHLSLKDMLLEGYQKAMKASGKDVVLVIGVTGSGKSTTIAHLMGAPLEADINEGGDLVVKLRACMRKEKYPIIGETTGSQTLYPEIWPAVDRTFLCDSPGFFDNRKGLERRIAISINTELVVRSAKSVKVVAIVSHPDIAGKAKSFLEVTDLLGKLFVDPAKTSASVLWVITKPMHNKLTEEQIYSKVHDKQKGVLGLLYTQVGVIRDSVAKLYDAYLQPGGSGAVLLQGIATFSSLFSSSQGTKKDVEDLSRQEAVIKGVRKDNLFLLKIFNPDGSLNLSSRGELLSRVRELPSIAASAFDFDAYEEARIKFRDLEDRVMDDAIKLFREREKLQTEEAKCRTEIRNIEERLQIYERGKESSDKSVFRSIQSGGMASVKKEIEQLTEQESKNKREIERLRAACEPLKSDKEVVIYRHNINKHVPWSWIEETFGYKGKTRITRHHEQWDKEKGNLTSELLETEYQATYVGGWFQNAAVEVTLYSQERYIPSNQALFDDYLQHIDQLESENESFRQRVADLTEKLGRLSHSELNASVVTQEIRQLNEIKIERERELIQKRAELSRIDQQIKGEESSFGMFYDLLSLSLTKSRLAEEFQRLYRLHIGDRTNPKMSRQDLPGQFGAIADRFKSRGIPTPSEEGVQERRLPMRFLTSSPSSGIASSSVDFVDRDKRKRAFPLSKL